MKKLIIIFCKLFNFIRRNVGKSRNYISTFSQIHHQFNFVQNPAKNMDVLFYRTSFTYWFYIAPSYLVYLPGQDMIEGRIALILFIFPHTQRRNLHSFNCNFDYTNCSWILHCIIILEIRITRIRLNQFNIGVFF